MRWGTVLGLVLMATPALAQNTPPPTPGIQYPDGTELVCSDQPTIIFENVDDPDGDEVTYHVQIDSNPCFCSAEMIDSGPLPEGDLVTQYTLPRPLNTDPAAGGHTIFYIMRWASDGLDDSPHELSLFETTTDCDGDPGGDGDGDVDADVDGDGDGDVDADVDADADDDLDDDGHDDDGKHVTYGCCTIAGNKDDRRMASLSMVSALAMVITLRRRRR